MAIAVPPTGNTVAAEAAPRAGLPSAPAWRPPPAKPSSNPAASAARTILMAGPRAAPHGQRGGSPPISITPASPAAPGDSPRPAGTPCAGRSRCTGGSTSLTIGHSGVRMRVTLAPRDGPGCRLPLVPRRPAPSSTAAPTAASRTSTSGRNERRRPTWTGSKHPTSCSALPAR